MLPMEPIAGVEFILGDFREDSVLEQLKNSLGDVRVDLVISDMAPNLSGVRSADSARIQHVCDLPLDFSRSHFQPGGALIEIGRAHVCIPVTNAHTVCHLLIAKK